MAGRLLKLSFASCLCSATLCTAASAADYVGPQSSTAASPSIPADAVIGRVLVHVEEIFDESDPAEDKTLYRWANALHRRTREEAIRAQLLFASGDPYSPRELQETERTLRANGYLAEAVVRPSATRGNEVDVDVIVRDVWTLVPEVSFGRAGGRNHNSVALEDPNFLGSGKSFQIERRTDADRTQTGLHVVDPNLFGSRWRLGLGFSDNSDGHTRELAVGRPFFELDSEWSASFLYSQDERELGHYSLGEQIDRFRGTHEQIRAEGGFSRGVVDGWTKRWLFGVAREDVEFGEAVQPMFARVATSMADALPADRHFLYPWVGWEAIEDAYAETTNLNQIGRVEDLYLGTRARFELGFSPARAGTPATALFAGRAHTTHSWDDGQQLMQFGAEAAGRFSDGLLSNSRLDLSAEYFKRVGEKQVWVARLTGSAARELDADEQLLLGGDTGLRGYPLRYQGGTTSALLTLEHRYFTDWYPFRLARVGGAVFFDVGRTWGADVVGTPNLGWLKDVGFGLRLGNARSSHGSVIHLDVAMPLDRSGDISAVQFLVSTHKSF